MEPSYRFWGDKQIAKEQIKRAERELNIHRDAVRLGDLSQHRTKRVFGDGLIVECLTEMGQETINVYWPPKGGKKEITEQQRQSLVPIIELTNGKTMVDWMYATNIVQCFEGLVAATYIQELDPTHAFELVSEDTNWGYYLFEDKTRLRLSKSDGKISVEELECISWRENGPCSWGEVTTSIPKEWLLRPYESGDSGPYGGWWNSGMWSNLNWFWHTDTYVCVEPINNWYFLDGYLYTANSYWIAAKTFWWDEYGFGQEEQVGEALVSPEVIELEYKALVQYYCESPIPGTGHWLPLDRYEDVCDRVETNTKTGCSISSAWGASYNSMIPWEISDFAKENYTDYNTWMVIYAKEYFEFATDSHLRYESYDTYHSTYVTIFNSELAPTEQYGALDYFLSVSHNGERYDFPLPLFSISKSSHTSYSTVSSPLCYRIYDYSGVPVFVYSMYNGVTGIIQYGYVFQGKHYQSEAFNSYVFNSYWRAHDFFNSIQKFGTFSLGGIRMGVKKTVETKET